MSKGSVILKQINRTRPPFDQEKHLLFIHLVRACETAILILFR